MGEVEIPQQSVEWLWYGVKDVDGIIGRHRVGIRYMDLDLEAKRMKRLERLEREEEGPMNGQGDVNNVGTRTSEGSECGR